MLSYWLADPEVRRWFDDPDYIKELETQFDDPRIRMWIVLLNDRPVAYVQDYDIHGWEDHPLEFLPSGARGVDTFVGEAADRGRGVGSAYLATFADRLLAEGAPAVGIDPHPDNTAAIRAYRKAGFRPHDPIVTKWGPALPMSLRPMG